MEINVKKKQTAKTMSWYEQWKNLNSWREKPASDAFIEKLCEKLFEHFENPDNQKEIHFIKYLHKLGISFEVFQTFLERSEKLRDVYKYILEKIGMLREDLAIYKKYNCNPQSLHFTLHHYHPFWQRAFEENKANNTSTNTPRVQYVVIEKTPETDIVPLKKEESSRC